MTAVPARPLERGLRRSTHRSVSAGTLAAWLFVLTLPTAVVAAVTVTEVLSDHGVIMGMPRSPVEAVVQSLLNYSFFVSVTGPLTASATAGLQTWRERREPLALLGARVSTALLVLSITVIVLSW